jgi:hypothetical protein
MTVSTADIPVLHFAEVARVTHLPWGCTDPIRLYRGSEAG